MKMDPLIARARKLLWERSLQMSLSLVTVSRRVRQSNFFVMVALKETFELGLLSGYLKGYRRIPNSIRSNSIRPSMSAAAILLYHCVLRCKSMG
jgi:hypothetical protein